MLLRPWPPAVSSLHLPAINISNGGGGHRRGKFWILDLPSSCPGPERAAHLPGRLAASAGERRGSRLPCSLKTKPNARKFLGSGLHSWSKWIVPQMNTMFPRALAVNSEKKMNFLFYMPFNFNISFNLNWSDSHWTVVCWGWGGGAVRMKQLCHFFL